MKALTLYKFEFKRRLRSNLFYTLAVVWLIFTFMAFLDVVQQSAPQLEAFFESFGSDFLKAFGTDAQGIATIPGYFGTRIGFLLVIVGGIMAVYVGVNTIAGEISSKTLSFLITKPLTRKVIYWTKALAIITHFAWVNFVLFVCSVASVSLLSKESGLAYIGYFGMIFLGVFVLQLFFLGVGLTLGNFLHSSKAIPLGIALVIAAYVVDVLSKLANSVQDLKYITPNYYIDFEHVAEYTQLRPEVWLLVLVAFALLIAGFIGFISRDIEG